MTKLALLTTNYKQNQLTNEFLSQLSQNKQIKDVLVVVADLSDKREKTPIKTILPNQLLVRGPNRGYAYGINLGVKEALQRGASLFCVINNDTVIKPDFITSVFASFRNYDAFGGKIYYAPGFEYHQNRYQKSELGRVIWYAGGIIDWNNVYAVHRGVDQVDRGQYNQPETTDFITGCLFCFNKKVFTKVGFWDEKYFLYFEDTDYSVRIKRAGFELVYNPEVMLWHKSGQSTEGAASPLQQKWLRSSRLRFGLKFAPLKTKLHLIKNTILTSNY